MRTILSEALTAAVARLCVQANTQLPADVTAALNRCRQSEPWPLARETMGLLQDNLIQAKERDLPICQDTGMACVFVELGQEVHIQGDFERAIHQGVRQGYGEGCLRKSIVGDPLRRVNTGDNTPASITVRLTPGDRCTVTVVPKGFGSENMSRLAMLKPADGLEGVKRFVVETVRLAGPNPVRPLCWESASAAPLTRWRRWQSTPCSGLWMWKTPTPFTPLWSRNCWRKSTP